MRIATFVLALSFLSALFTGLHAQSQRPNPEKIWKDFSRLPQTLRDELKKSSWWETGKTTATRLDSILHSTRFGSGKSYPLNKSIFEYPTAQVSIQSDFVNYGEWLLQKRVTVTRDAQNRITEAFEEVPDPDFGILQASVKTLFYWHGKSDTQCDSIRSNQWDESTQQWQPALRLYSAFDAQGREVSSETYRYEDGYPVAGVREEFLLDAAGDVTLTRQTLLKDGKWMPLGKVESKFDKQHREITRQEDIAQEADQYVPVRKLTRIFDGKGSLAREERYKWSEATQQWAPLKTISRGADTRNRSEWVMTESYKPNAFFKSRLETFRHKNDDNTDHEIQSAFKADTKKWQVQSETKYYYAQ